MDFNSDYAWSGVNYCHPYGLPTIGTTLSALPQRISRPPPSNTPQFAIKQNRNFGDRWHIRRSMELSRSGPVACIDDYDPMSTSFPLTMPPKPKRAHRLPRPGFNNCLERDLYSYLPKHQSGFYSHKEALPPRHMFARTR